MFQVERKDLAWERWYDLSSQEIGEMIKAPKCDPVCCNETFRTTAVSVDGQRCLGKLASPASSHLQSPCAAASCFCQ